MQKFMEAKKTTSIRHEDSETLKFPAISICTERKISALPKCASPMPIVSYFLGEHDKPRLHNTFLICFGTDRVC
jgi:hypothetical protein